MLLIQWLIMTVGGLIAIYSYFCLRVAHMGFKPIHSIALKNPLGSLTLLLVNIPYLTESEKSAEKLSPKKRDDLMKVIGIEYPSVIWH